MKTRIGNLIQMANSSQIDVLVHGCNCFHLMGAGIAKQVAYYFPIAEIQDKKTRYGDPLKVGTYSHCLQLNNTGKWLTVVNAYTQYHIGPDARLKAIESSFSLIGQHFGHLRIGYPKIGCGIGGLDWKEVEPIIEYALKGLDHTLVVLPTVVTAHLFGIQKLRSILDDTE